jgi:hypothetical protein
VATAVRVAADHGLRVAVWSTGHDPAPLGDLRDTLLLRTDRMRAVAVDRPPAGCAPGPAPAGPTSSPWRHTG